MGNILANIGSLAAAQYSKNHLAHLNGDGQVTAADLDLAFAQYGLKLTMVS